jgi:hypothetical protein
MNFYRQLGRDTNTSFDRYFTENAVIEYVHSWHKTIEVMKEYDNEKVQKVDVTRYWFRHAKPCTLEDLPEVLQLLIRK